MVSAFDVRVNWENKMGFKNYLPKGILARDKGAKKIGMQPTIMGGVMGTSPDFIQNIMDNYHDAFECIEQLKYFYETCSLDRQVKNTLVGTIINKVKSLRRDRIFYYVQLINNTRQTDALAVECQKALNEEIETHSRHKAKDYLVVSAWANTKSILEKDSFKRFDEIVKKNSDKLTQLDSYERAHDFIKRGDYPNGKRIAGKLQTRIDAIKDNLGPDIPANRKPKKRFSLLAFFRR